MRRSGLGALAIAACAGLLAACAPAEAPPPVAPTVSVAPRTEAGPADAPAAAGAVDRPAGVLAVARGKFPVLSGWRHGAATPPGWAELAELLPLLRGRFEPGVVVDDAILEEVDPAAPSELLVVAEAGARPLVVSVPVRDRARAIQVLERSRLQSVRIAGGAVLVPLPGGGACAVAPSVGSAHARMVCSEAPDAVRGVVAYATRTLPELDLPRGSLSARLFGDPIRRAAGGTLGGGSLLSTYVALRWFPRLSVWLPGAGEVLVERGAALLADLDQLDLRVDMDREERDLHVDIRLVPGAKALASSAPIPADVQRVPADAHTVLFGAAGAAAFLAKLEGPVSAALRGDPALARAMPDLFVPRGPIVYAAGFGGPGGEARQYRRVPESWTQHVRRVAVEFAGWHLFSVEEPIERMALFLAALARADGDGSLRSLYYGAFPSACRGLPPFKPRKAPLPGLPRGSVAYEMTLTPAFFDKCTGNGVPSSTRENTVDALIVAVPDGSRTWIGLSLDRDLLVGKLQKVLATRGAPSTDRYVAGGRMSEAGSRVWQSLAGIGAWRDDAAMVPLPFSVRVTDEGPVRIEIAAKAPHWQ